MTGYRKPSLISGRGARERTAGSVTPSNPNPVTALSHCVIKLYIIQLALSPTLQRHPTPSSTPSRFDERHSPRRRPTPAVPRRRRATPASATAPAVDDPPRGTPAPGFRQQQKAL